MMLLEVLSKYDPKIYYQIMGDYLYAYGNFVQIPLTNLLYLRGSISNYEYVTIGILERNTKVTVFTIKKIKLLLPINPEPVYQLPRENIQRYLSNNRSFLGKGLYGSVISSGDYAIKTFFLGFTDSPYLEATFLREVSTLIRLKHPNIVEIIDVVKGSPENFQGNEVSIILPLAKNNLENYMRNTPRYDPIIITYQILKGMEYIHSKDIVHFDLKTDNILVYGDLSNPIIKISDFGLSTPAGCETSSLQGNGYMIYYRPLEIMFALGYSTSADIWALGCLIYTIFTKKYLFYSPIDNLIPDDEDLKIIIVNRIFETLGNLGGKYPELSSQLKKMRIEPPNVQKEWRPYRDVNNPHIEEIINLMLEYNPSQRIKVSEILTREPFKTLNKKSGILDVECPGILDERQKYQVVLPFEEVNYTNLRIKVFRRLLDIIELLVSKKHRVSILDYFPITYIFDYSINQKVPLTEESLKIFITACAEIWFNYKYGESHFGNKKYSNMEVDNRRYFEQVNAYVEQILNILNFDIIASTINNYINTKDIITKDSLYIRAVEQMVTSKHLPADIVKSIKVHEENPEYFDIIRLLI